VNGNASNGNGNGRVTYAEVRRMARWLNAFTPRELAEALHVHEAVAERFVVAMLWTGHVGGSVISDTGAWLDGPEGRETLYEIVPLPDTVYRRNRYLPPEVQAVVETGGLLLYNHRGLPVRIRTERSQRRAMSTPGSRQLHKDRERAYQRQQDAVRRRMEIDRKKRIAASQGRTYVPEEAK